MSEEIRVLHVISGLEVGGAETMLCRLIEHSDDNIRHHVVPLRGRGPLATRVESHAELTPLNLKSWRLPAGVIQLARVIKRARPHVVQGWLCHGMLVGSIAARLAGGPPIVWSIHSGLAEAVRLPLGIRGIVRVLAAMSGSWPVRIVSCAQSAKDRHAAMGFAAEKIEVIPNGTPTDLFKHQAGAASRVRSELGIPKGAAVLGIVGRWAPEKDFKNFFAAARRLQKRIPSTHFILCGRGLTRQNPAVRAEVEGCPDPKQFHLLGLRSDMPAVYSACDVVTLSSASEAFPLTLGEAMACSTPCVATDVGDSRQIVGDTGLVVPPHSPDQLSSAWERILNLSIPAYRDLSERARARIESRFSVDRCITLYRDLFRDFAPRPERGFAIRPARLSPVQGLVGGRMRKKGHRSPTEAYGEVQGAHSSHVEQPPTA